MDAHRYQEARVESALLAQQDLGDHRLHVVVDAPTSDAPEEDRSGHSQPVGDGEAGDAPAAPRRAAQEAPLSAGTSCWKGAAMLREDILAQMTQLKLKGMLGAYDEIVSLGLKKRATPEKILHELLMLLFEELHMTDRPALRFPGFHLAAHAVIGPLIAAPLTCARCCETSDTSSRSCAPTGHLASPAVPSTRSPQSASPFAAPFIPGFHPRMIAAPGWVSFRRRLPPKVGNYCTPTDMLPTAAPDHGRSERAHRRPEEHHGEQGQTDSR